MQLARLCAVLPAASSSFCSNKASSSPPDSLQQGQRSQQQGSGAAAAEPTAAGEDILLGHEDEGLLLEVRAVLLQLPCAGNSTSGRQAAGCRVSNSAAVLGRLQQRLHVLCLKQRVLNEQLSFLAKCSAAQAKLMTALASDVLQELTAAVGRLAEGCKWVIQAGRDTSTCCLPEWLMTRQHTTTAADHCAVCALSVLSCVCVCRCCRACKPPAAASQGPAVVFTAAESSRPGTTTTVGC